MLHGGKNVIKSYFKITIIQTSLLIFIAFFPFLYIHEKEFYKPLNNFLPNVFYHNFGLFFVLLIIGLVISLIVSVTNVINFILPIEQIKKSLENIKQGKFKNINIKTTSTIQPIIESINIAINQILEEKYNTAEVANILEEYKKALDINFIVFKIHTDKKIIDVNQNFCEFSGTTKEEIIGTCFDSIQHNEKQIEKFNDMFENLLQKKTRTGIIKNIKKNGDEYRIKINAIPIIGQNGNIIEFISIGTDVTEQIISEEKVRQSYYKLKELDQKKDDFLNIASHELRTPMTSIKGYCSMILDGDAGECSDHIKSFIQIIYNNAKRLISLINDMLDLSKIETNSLQFNYEDVNLSQFLENIYTEINVLAKEKNISLIMDNQVSKNKEFYLCENKLRHVLINIIGNAIKFTNEGGNIVIKSNIDGDYLSFAIKDNGIGISKEDINKIFDKFVQISNPMKNHTKGTGLGLSIVKSIIERLNGTVNVESELGKGSTFTVKIPIIQKFEINI